MITEPIVITGRLNYEDLLEVRRFRQRRAVRASILVLMGVISGSLLALMVGLSTVTELKPSGYLIIAFFVYWPWGWLMIRRFSGRGRLRRAAASLTDNTATFTDDSISMAGEDASARFAWRRLGEVVQTRDGLMFLLPRGAVWIYLPARVLHENDRSEILAAAAAHNVRVTTAK